MGNDDRRRMKLTLCRNNQPVDIHAAQRVQTCRRFIIEYDPGFQRNSPRQTDSFFHAPRKVIGHHILCMVQSDKMQLFPDDIADFLLRELAVLSEAKGHIFTDTHRIKQGRVLKNHAHMEPYLIHLIFCKIRDVLAVYKNMAAGRLLKSDDQAQNGTLA